MVIGLPARAKLIQSKLSPCLSLLPLLQEEFAGVVARVESLRGRRVEGCLSQSFGG